MKSLLQAYFDVGAVDVERTGSCLGYQWDISWTSKGGSQPLIQVIITGILFYATSLLFFMITNIIISFYHYLIPSLS